MRTLVSYWKRFDSFMMNTHMNLWFAIAVYTYGFIVGSW